MRISGLPRMADKTAQGTRHDRRRRLPVPVLVILGLYIGFVAYSLLSDDTLGPPAGEAGLAGPEESVTRNGTNPAG